MALSIDSFRQVKMPHEMTDNRSLASLKVDSSKGGEAKLKLFGMGKTFAGRMMRANDGMLNKIYSFFHDPSGKANRSLRREFVAAFKKEFGELAEGIEKHVDPKSRKPLNAAVVVQLIAKADAQKTQNPFRYGQVDLSHSSFEGPMKLESAFIDLAAKGGFSKNGSALLDRLDQIASQTGFSPHQEAVEIPYEDLHVMCGGHWRSPIVPGSEGERTMSINRLLDGISEQNLEKLRDAGIDVDQFALTCFRQGDVNDLKVIGSKLMKAVASGDHKEIERLGDELVALTRDLKKAVDHFVDVMVDPKVREIFANDRTEPSDFGELQGLDLYNAMVFGAQQMSRMMSEPGSGFQALIALGAMARNRPEILAENLGERPVRPPENPPPEEMRPNQPPPRNPLDTGLDIVEIHERALVLKLDENGTIQDS